MISLIKGRPSLRPLPSSLRAKRSNPEGNAKRVPALLVWIASRLAMTDLRDACGRGC
ncbi:MAG: hypothetical protein LBT00_04075 [Spirochaetaceae bacterium]|nr:hypothetical protein [Spirochaetaceae bacterium]